MEMVCLAHIIDSPVYYYDATQRHHIIWAAHFPSDVDRSILEISDKSHFIFILPIVTSV